MSETPMERLERTLSRFNDKDLVPGELLRVEDLRAVVAVAKDARSWSDDVTKLVARVKELEAEIETESILGQATQSALASAHATYAAWYAEWAEEAANRAREWTLRAVMKKVIEFRLPATADELCSPARKLTAEELLRPWTH